MFLPTGEPLPRSSSGSCDLESTASSLACGSRMDELRGGDVFRRDAHRLEHGRSHRRLFRPRKDFTDLGENLRLRQNHVAGFLEYCLARVDDEGVRHDVVVELAPGWARRADRIDVGARLEPGTF